MNLEDGYASVSYGGAEHPLTPSFANMAKLGDPDEIIQKMHTLYMYSVAPISSFMVACEVLTACGIPEQLLSGLNFSEWKNRVMIDIGVIHPDDMIVLAKHCMQHGICGNEKQLSKVEKGQGAKLESFDPAEYIVAAKDYLDLTLDEAEGLTMAKFVRLSTAKTEMEKRRYMKQNKIPTKAESESLVNRELELAEQYAAARAKKKAKEKT